MQRLILSLFLSSFFALLEPSEGLTQSLYSFSDLEILEREKNYLEFLKHARDIRPSERNKMWKQMVSEMSVGYMKQIIQRKQWDKKTFKFVESLLDWPTLINDAFFVQQRDRYGLNYLENCYQKNKTPTECTATLKRFWARQHSDPNLGIALGKLLFQHDKPAQTQSWNLYQNSVRHELSEFYCKNLHVQQMLIQQIQRHFSESKLKQLNQLMHADCWKQLLPYLKQALFSGNSVLKDLAYHTLRFRGELDRAQSDLFHILYLLDNPGKGETFNQAWNTLVRLGEDYARRRQVYQQLKQLDPLPDGLFGISDAKKKLTLTDMLSKKMPEYLNFYAKHCLAYLKGEKKFPRGNPTPHCHQFFQLSEGTIWVNQQLQNKYRKIPKY